MRYTMASRSPGTNSPWILVVTLVLLVADCVHAQECKTQADIGVVLDRSGSVRNAGWKQVVNFMNLLVDKLDIGEDKIRLGVVSFSSSAKIEFHLDKHYDKDKIKKEVADIKLPAGRTNTPKALKELRKNLFKASKGDRPGVPNLALVMTDGKVSVHKKKLPTEAKELHDTGATVFAIGVGKGVVEDELQAIASSPQHVIKADQFDKLDTLLDQLVQMTCQEAEKAQPEKETLSWDHYKAGFELAQHSTLSDEVNTIIILSPSKLTFSAAGFTFRWQFYASRTGVVFLQIWRRDSGVKNKFFLKGEIRYQVETTGLQVVKASTYGGMDVAILKGDLLGLYFKNANPVGYKEAACPEGEVYVAKVPAKAPKLGEFVTGNSAAQHKCRDYGIRVTVLTSRFHWKEKRSAGFSTKCASFQTLSDLKSSKRCKLACLEDAKKKCKSVVYGTRGARDCQLYSETKDMTSCWDTSMVNSDYFEWQIIRASCDAPTYKSKESKSDMSVTFVNTVDEDVTIKYLDPRGETTDYDLAACKTNSFSSFVGHGWAANSSSKWLLLNMDCHYVVSEQKEQYVTISDFNPDSNVACKPEPSEQCESGGPLFNLPLKAGFWLNIFTTMTFSCAGNVAEWEFFADGKGTFFASVWRVLKLNTFRLVGKNKIKVQKLGQQVFKVTENDQIMASVGDVIGVHYEKQDKKKGKGVIAYAANTGKNKHKDLKDSDYHVVHNKNTLDKELDVGTEVSDVIRNMKRTLALRAKITEISVQIVLGFSLGAAHSYGDMVYNALGTKHTAQSFGVSYVEGKDNTEKSCMEFTGKAVGGSYVKIPKYDILDFKTSFTLMTDIYISKLTDQEYSTIFSYETPNGEGIFLKLNKVDLWIGLRQRGKKDDLTGSIFRQHTNITLEKWLTVGLSYSYQQGKVTLYVNGVVELESTDIGKRELATEGAVLIAQSSAGATQQFFGRMTCLRFYNKHFSDNKIKSMKECGLPTLVLPKKPKLKIISKGEKDKISKDNLAFKCSFEVIKKKKMEYQVRWYAGEKLDKIHSEWVKGVDYAKTKETSVTLTKAAYKDKNIFKGVECGVVSCEEGNCQDLETPPIRSKTIKAEIEINTDEKISLVKGIGHTSLKVEVLMPTFGFCDGQEDCEIRVEASSQDDEQYKCLGGTANIPRIVFGFWMDQFESACGITINKDNWQGNHSIQVKATMDGLIEKVASIERVVTIQQSVAVNGQDPTTKTIKQTTVSITNQGSAGDMCVSTNDPHISTFDKYAYDNFFEGEFVFYRHKKHAVTIHTAFRKCNPMTGASCTCGVAVRVGSTVVVFDRCGFTATTKASFPLQVHMYKDGPLPPGFVIRRLDQGATYNIMLPTGGKLIIKYGWSNFLDLFLTPSATDWSSTEGLCGDYDGKSDNDVKQNKDDDFSLSWRVSEKESLLLGYCGKADTNEAASDVMFCNCPVKAEDRLCLPNFDYEPCSQQTVTVQGKTNGTDKHVKWTSHAGKRIKGKDEKTEVGVETAWQCRDLCLKETDFECKSVEYGQRLSTKPCVLQSVNIADAGNDWFEKDPMYVYSELSTSEDAIQLMTTRGMDITEELYAEGKAPICGDIPDKFKYKFDIDYVFKPPDSLPDGWTETSIAAHCKHEISNAVPACSKLDLPRQQTEKNCKTDIKNTGHKEWVSSGISWLVQQCRVQVLHSTTLWVKTGDVLGPDMSILDTLCPNDCTDTKHGHCKKGVCSCEAEWGGHDCSIKLSTAPTIHEVNGGVGCNLQADTCKSFAVTGIGFGFTETLTCTLEEIDGINDKNKTGKSLTMKASFVSMNSIMCVIEIQEMANTNNYLVSVSLDGINFSTEEVIFATYNPDCQDCDWTAWTCTNKQDSCVIDGKCWGTGDVNTKSDTEKCIPDKSSTSWTTIKALKLVGLYTLDQCKMTTNLVDDRATADDDKDPKDCKKDDKCDKKEKSTDCDSA